MNDIELLESLADQAPLPPPGYPLTILKRARRARRVRALAIGGGTVAAVVPLLLTLVVLRPGGGPSLPPAQTGESYPGVVHLNPGTTPEQKAAIQSTLDGTHGVSEARLVPPEEAYRKFAEMFKDAPDLVASARPADMPESFEFQASATADRRDLLRRLRVLPGVAFSASPRPQVSSWSPSPGAMAAPEMGVPEARLYGEQLILLATAVWGRPAPPKTIQIVDGFCQTGKAHAGCLQHRFSPLLRTELQNRVGEYATVVFVDVPNGPDLPVKDTLVVDLGPLAAHHIGGQTLWLNVRGADHSEYARFDVSWNGERWVAGQWTGGAVSTTPS